MKAKKKALAAIAVANQGANESGDSSLKLRAQNPNGSPLSMIRCRVTPRGTRINAGRAFV